MDKFEIVPASEVETDDRRTRYPQLNEIEVGHAMFIPNSALSQHAVNPIRALQSWCSRLHKDTKRRYRVKPGQHKAHRGVWVIRDY